jgi:hypothetical protein
MNIVQMILDQLLGGGLGKLSSLMGENETKTESALGAAVPSILTAISGLASDHDGAQRLVTSLGKFSPASLGNLGDLLSGQPESVAEKGNSILNSLFGGNVLSGLIGSLSRFAGLGNGPIKSLLGYVTPLVLGAVAKQFLGKPITQQGLMGFFADQKNNIANALPEGLSLPGIPKAMQAESPRASYNAPKPAARKSYGTADSSTASIAKWVLPLVCLAALAALAYAFWPRRPDDAVAKSTKSPRSIESERVQTNKPILPDVDGVTTSLTADFSKLTDTLKSIKDPASALMALPKFTELAGSMDQLKSLVNALPEVGKTKVSELIRTNLKSVHEHFARVLMIPGVTDKLRPALEGIVNKMTALGGLPAAEFSLPSAELSALGGKISGLTTSLIESLNQVTDVESATAAIPKLEEFEKQLDATQVAVEKLPAAGRSTISAMLKTALTKLKDIVDKVVAIPGVGDQLKPVIDPIMEKLNHLAG